ncbi:uncharacterized protein LOC133803424 [Humulus lupulus]|uniref:uncharacterized protein LOC133803424 n=1 Tax=Humulus lupulus TaxID=3486 RepID=UPI002B40A50B|nr:uncharacterized protein LOC133803424 [Humulus lupulus]
MVANTQIVVDDTWLLNSGASHHLTPAPSTLDHVDPYTVIASITVGNGVVGKPLSRNDGELLEDATEDRRTIGSLQNLTLTHPDIAFVVNRECQFTQSPTSVHWLAVKCILRYSNLVVRNISATQLASNPIFMQVPNTLE